MSEVKLSERAQKIWALITPPFEKGGPGGILSIRQQTLAEEFNCSRRTIGRALKELKEASLLVDLNRRHENRCKLYEIKIPLNPPFAKGEKEMATQKGVEQLKLYRFTFESNFREWPDWEKHYPQVSWELRHETDMNVLFRQTFDKLYVIQAASKLINTQSPNCSVRRCLSPNAS